MPEDVQRTVLRKLTQIHGATVIDFLQILPAGQLEKLSGEREGQWSIRINNQWRICFRWLDGNAYDVEIVDYR